MPIPIECSYMNLRSDSTVKRPGVLIVPRNRPSKKRVIKATPLWALIDSGADFCVFPRWVADELELPWSKGRYRPVSALGQDQIPAYEHTVSIELLCYPRHELQTKVRFLAHGLPFALLGQKGFFENLLITFDHQLGKFWLYPRF